MSDIAVRVEGLGKKYRLGHTVDLQRSFRETLTGLPLDIARKLASPFRRKKNASVVVASGLSTGTSSQSQHAHSVEEDFWALRDVSFEVRQGETVGIIGRNGAGKSTLLKMLSRVVAPSAGRAEMYGRLASLLEVGTGFHAELTGRENIYLNGAILGMKKAEIDRKFDEIVDFSEIEQFLDTPVKRYSSGMYVRLAFAVAAHLEPEIMIVDEVLAVGDAAFQKKCLGKMSDVAKAGRTVLIVSHQMSSIRNLCSSCILFQNGHLANIGTPSEMIPLYLGSSCAEAQSLEWQPTESSTGRKAEPYLRFTRMALVDTTGQPLPYHPNPNQTAFLQIEMEVLKKDERQCVGFILTDDQDNEILYSYHTDNAPEEWPQLQLGKVVLRVPLEISILNEGRYKVILVNTLHCISMAYSKETSDIALSFEIVGKTYGSPYWTKKRNCLLAPKISWRTV
jgi:lipopolysaccharide transport system ATP-binding protein